MQAVILCAGQSTRTFPLTVTRPKPLLKVGDKTLLEHNLNSLLGIVSEVILVVGYKKEMIQEKIGTEYGDIKITYVEQTEQKGTGHALQLTEKNIENSFFLLMGDDLYEKDDMEFCNVHDYAILAKEVEDPSNFGVIIEENTKLKDFVEKPESFVSNLANTAFYKLDKKIFDYLDKIEESKRGEIELPDALLAFAKEYPIEVVKTNNWTPVGYPWDLLSADLKIRKNESTIGENTTISGDVINSNIGDNCIIEGEVKNSVIMDNTAIKEGSVIENSVIGENVTFLGIAKAEKNVETEVKGKMLCILT